MEKQILCFIYRLLSINYPLIILITMRKIIGIAVLALIFFSCKKDQEDFKKLQDGDFTIENWEPTYVVPLVNTETTMGEIFSSVDTLIERLETDKNLTISVNEDNLFVLSYDASVETDNINTYYKIPDVDENISLTIPPTALLGLSSLPVGTTFSDIWDTTFTFKLSPDYNALLEEAIFDGGELTFTHTGTNINQQIDILLTVKSIINETSGDTVKLNLDYSPANSGSSVTEVFTNHNADFRDENLIGDDQFNKFQVNIKVSGTKINPIVTGSNIELTATASDFNLCYVQGFLGEFDTKIDSGIVAFDIFSGENLDGIHFRDPKVIFDFESTAGLPMTAEIIDLSLGYEDSTKQTLGVDGEEASNAGIDDLSDIPNNPARNSYVVDNSSQLDELLFSSPNKLIYDLDAKSAFSAPNGNFRFFLDKRSKVKMNILAELPVDFSVENYEFSDTTELDGVGFKMDLEADSIDSDYFKRAALKLVLKNQLPIEALVQGYLLDSNNVLLDSVFSDGFEPVLANNNIGSDGIAGNAQDVVTIVDIDQDKFNNFLKTSNIVYVIKANTSNSTANSFGDVKILDTYTFGLRAGLLAEFDVDLNKELELSDNK